MVEKNYQYTKTLMRVGDSLCITLPPMALAQLKLKQGDLLAVTYRPKEKDIIISGVR